MKLSRVMILTVVALLSADVCMAQTRSRADRAWKPFFATLRAAVKDRDRQALSKVMSRDFYYLSSGGDENGDQDTRDEAFEYWESTGIGALDALEKILAQGTAVNTAMREPGNRRLSRIAPPIANNRRAIRNKSFPWYAVFEYRDGRWQWIALNECCD